MGTPQVQAFKVSADHPALHNCSGLNLLDPTAGHMSSERMSESSAKVHDTFNHAV